jgi:hypothetical protein
VSPIKAFVFCCLLAAATGSLTLATAAVLLTSRQSVDFLTGIAALTLSWIAISTFAGVILAAPFALVATWAGRRLRIECALYYSALGAMSASIVGLLWFVIPLPRPETALEHAFKLAFTLSAPVYGGVWGATWWHLHRRWKTEPDQAPR